MSSYLSDLFSSPIGQLQQVVEGFEAALPSPLHDHARCGHQMVTGAVDAQGTISEAFGFQYVGPVNGHDIDQLMGVLRAIGERIQFCSTVVP